MAYSSIYNSSIEDDGDRITEAAEAGLGCSEAESCLMSRFESSAESDVNMTCNYEVLTLNKPGHSLQSTLGESVNSSFNIYETSSAFLLVSVARKK